MDGWMEIGGRGVRVGDTIKCHEWRTFHDDGHGSDGAGCRWVDKSQTAGRLVPSWAARCWPRALGPSWQLSRHCAEKQPTVRWCRCGEQPAKVWKVRPKCSSLIQSTEALTNLPSRTCMPMPACNMEQNKADYERIWSRDEAVPLVSAKSDQLDELLPAANRISQECVWLWLSIRLRNRRKKSKRESRKSPQQLEENSQQDNEWQTNHGCYFRTDTTGHFKGRLVHSVRLGSSSSLRHLAKSIGFHSAAVIYYYHSPSVSQIRFSLQTNCTKETHSVLIRS